MVEKSVARRYLPAESESNDAQAIDHVPAEKSEKPIVEDREVISPITIDDDAVSVGLPERNLSMTPSTAAELAAAEMPTGTPGLLKRFVSSLPPIIFLLGSRRILVAIFTCTIESALLTSFDALLPLFVRHTFGWNSTGAGLLFIALTVPAFISPLIGHYADSHGPRWLATAGFVICAPIFILLRLVHENTIGQKVLLCALLVIIGLGLVLALTPLMAEIAYAVDEEAQRRPPGFFGKNGAYAQAYSLFNVAFAAGCFVGPLLAGLVNEAHGWGPTTLMLGCISIFTAVPTVIWTGGSIFRRKERGERNAVSEA